LNITNYISSGYIEGYLFGMLTPDEVLQFDTLLKQSPVLKAEYERVQQSLQGYVEAHAVVPPANMQEQIWAKLQKQEQKPQPLVEEVVEKAPEKVVEKEFVKPVPPPPAVKQEQKSAPLKIHKLEDTDSAKPVRRFRLAPWFAAASFIGMMAASYLANDYYNNWQQAEGKITAYQSEKNKLASEMEAQKASMKTLADENEWFRKPSLKFIKLEGKAISPKSDVIICWDREGKDVMVTYANMPKPPEGKQYQLWAIQDGKPIDLGMIDMNATKKGVAHMKSVAKAQAFAITLEKVGGSASPTLEQMYVFGNI